MDREAWHAAIHGVSKNRPRLSNWTELNWTLFGVTSGILRSAHVCSVVFSRLWPRGLWPARLLCPWDLPGKNTGAGGHVCLQGIFLTQGLNPPLFTSPTTIRWILYHQCHMGSLRGAWISPNIELKFSFMCDLLLWAPSTGDPLRTQPHAPHLCSTVEQGQGMTCSP